MVHHTKLRQTKRRIQVAAQACRMPLASWDGSHVIMKICRKSSTYEFSSFCNTQPKHVIIMITRLDRSFKFARSVHPVLVLAFGNRLIGNDHIKQMRHTLGLTFKGRLTAPAYC